MKVSQKRHHVLVAFFCFLLSSTSIFSAESTDHPDIFLEPKKPYDYLIKLMMIGDSGVGKSSLLLRFVEDSFTPTFITTIGIDFKIKTLIHEGKTYKLQIWDTAGQERFKTITKAYFRSAMGIVVVYDVTNKKTFDNVSYWMKSIQEHSTENVDKILVGNKCDMVDHKCVDTEIALELAKKLHIPFYESSAKIKKNVDEIFLEILKLVKKRLIDGVQIKKDTKEDIIDIDEEKTNVSAVKLKKRSCC